MPRRVAQANAWIREASDQSRMNVQDGTGMADAQYALGAFYYARLGVPPRLYPGIFVVQSRRRALTHVGQRRL
jgi:TPR repeat protein